MKKAVAILIAIVVILCLGILGTRFEHWRGAANEAAAANHLARIAVAEDVYRHKHGGNYSQSLSELEGLEAEPSAYVFKYTPGAPSVSNRIDTYSATAEPRIPSETGNRYFYIDQSRLLRYEFRQRASAASPHL